MISTYVLYLVCILISLFLSYILVNKAAKYSKKIAKYKYVAYVTSFVFIYLGTLKVFSIFNPALMENYEDLLEHITIPKKFKNRPTTSIDKSIFEQKQITPSTTTVVSGPVDAVRDIPVAYVDPTPPPPAPTTYVPPAPTEPINFTGSTGPVTGFTGFTGFTEFTGYSDFVIFTSGPTGFTGNTGSSNIEYTGFTGYIGETGYTGYTGYTSPTIVAPVKEEEKKEEEKKEEGQQQLGNIDMNQLMPFMMGLASSLIAKQPEVNVNVFNDGNSSNPNINKYNMDNCLNDKNKGNNWKNKRDLYNYPSGKVRAYNEWKSTIDKDNDYIYVDQNKLNRNPRSSSCPVCPLDINYPFSNYRSGR